MTELTVQIAVRRLPLSGASLKALRQASQYDYVVFTSKNARTIFTQELAERRIALPRHSRIIQVGPRADLLKAKLAGKRILFPRSAVAPHDIVRRLRSKGAVVRVVPLYTTNGVPLSCREHESLLSGRIKQFYFKSPSGVLGLLWQLRGHGRQVVLATPARCIGATTAAAARKAGFKKVFIKSK